MSTDHPFSQDLAPDLRAALRAGDEIVPFYQPQIDMATGTPVAAEALARWCHPALGMLTPDVFIPLAERCGLMPALTRHMVGAALADCAGWRRDGLPMAVAVNVSAIDLTDSTLVDDVEAALRRHALPPEALVFEVTERDVMSDFERAADTLAQLRALGVGLSLDDFGTGHSSLARLRALPVHELKIDRSFVMAMTENSHDHAIVSAVVDLARRFGLRIVAEGVEDEDTWTALRALGCHTAQGYLLGRPQALPALLESAAVGAGAAHRDTSPERGLELLNAWLASAPTARQACAVTVRYLHARGYGLPSIYLRRGDRMRCQASVGYWQVVDGIPLGTGVIGDCIAQDRTLDVDLHTRAGEYVEAASGVRYEIAAPVRCDGRPVAVVNVEDVEAFGSHAVPELETVAASLGRRLQGLGAGVGESPGQQLGRLVERIAAAEGAHEVQRDLLHAACELTGLESAFVSVRSGDRWTRQATGPLGPAFSALPAGRVRELTEHVAHGASLVAAGDAHGQGLAELDDLRRAGATTLVLVALRHMGRNEGLLVVADRRPEPPATDRVELLELLAAHATSTLQTLLTVERLRVEASRDPLTGLGHRGAFLEALSRAVAEARPEEVVAVALVDLDHFKHVNDRGGHEAGDRLLREAAARLTARVRRGDSIFRVGGDEFAAVLRDASGAALPSTADRLRGAVAATGATTASVGISSWRPDEPVDALLARADEALQAAKDAGRDAVRLA